MSGAILLTEKLRREKGGGIYKNERKETNIAASLIIYL